MLKGLKEFADRLIKVEDIRREHGTAAGWTSLQYVLSEQVGHMLLEAATALLPEATIVRMGADQGPIVGLVPSARADIIASAAIEMLNKASEDPLAGVGMTTLNPEDMPEGLAEVIMADQLQKMAEVSRNN